MEAARIALFEKTNESPGVFLAAAHQSTLPHPGKPLGEQFPV